ncbi:MAG TPA: hypothetical protein VN761_13575, partial [Candidatus Polarisedimenticolia bacterium]|nr:hypothetical protein [Candidatus Polarisedimenticolia bacterium]
ILVRDEVPILPLFFYSGINYFDTNKIQGIYNNVVDLHPLQTIRKVHPTRISHAQQALATAAPETRNPKPDIRNSE